MTKPVKVISTRLKVPGEFGGILPTAVVAFYNMTKISCESLRASEGAANYDAPTNDLEEITYSASYWFNQESKVANFKPRPVENLKAKDDEHEFVFFVNVEDPKYAQILAQAGDSWDRVIQVIELHFKTEVAV